jgi:large subunit ribosomal protein L17
MRHLKKGRKLGTDASHTKAMLRSLAIAVFENERIKTTEARAKEVRSLVEKVITWGKKGDVHSRRLAIAALGDNKAVVAKVFSDIAPRFAEREGGYTRILKLGPRKGDAAPMVILELVD